MQKKDETPSAWLLAAAARAYKFRQGEIPIFLASGSPRRKELAGAMGLSFSVCPTDADETLPAGTPAVRAAGILAKRKAQAAVRAGTAQKAKNGIAATEAATHKGKAAATEAATHNGKAAATEADPLIVAADTVVDLDGRVLGKPTDAADAEAMLAALSGRTHAVHTGVAVAYRGRILCRTATTRVTFKKLNSKEIYTYVASGEPMDKAGAYGIQGGAGAFVTALQGDFDNVVGLPTRLLDELLCAVTAPRLAAAGGAAQKAAAVRKKKAPACKGDLSAARAKIAAIDALLSERYPEAVCALEYGGDPWRLLVMGRLSAQCTDARVNLVCRDLFKRYPTAAAMAEADLTEIEGYIRSCGLFHTKARDILAASQKLVREFNGVLPREMDVLLTFPGVGRKIANLLRGDLFGLPAVVADTHCIRLSGRFGFTPIGKKDPLLVEKTLTPLLEGLNSSDFCHRIVLFGRDVCTAASPQCGVCPLKAAGLCAGVPEKKHG